MFFVFSNLVLADDPDGGDSASLWIECDNWINDDLNYGDSPIGLALQWGCIDSSYGLNPEELGAYLTLDEACDIALADPTGSSIFVVYNGNRVILCVIRYKLGGIISSRTLRAENHEITVNFVFNFFVHRHIISHFLLKYFHFYWQ